RWEGRDQAVESVHLEEWVLDQEPHQEPVWQTEKLRSSESGSSSPYCENKRRQRLQPRSKHN
ncbi:hypothetical protein HDU99_004645, partial [Rhizoclosmatium hyalinum]